MEKQFSTSETLLSELKISFASCWPLQFLSHASQVKQTIKINKLIAKTIHSQYKITWHLPHLCNLWQNWKDQWRSLIEIPADSLIPANQIVTIPHVFFFSWIVIEIHCLPFPFPVPTFLLLYLLYFQCSIQQFFSILASVLSHISVSYFNERQ